MKQAEYEAVRKEAVTYYEKAGIILTDAEKENIEIADFGLGRFKEMGLILVTYVNTKRCCAKEMVLLPEQTCPEHSHVPIPELDYPGKEETFRCRYGEVFLYVEGEESSGMQAVKPKGAERYFEAAHEVILHAGEQYTMQPDTRHWFRAGKDGAVISEFSTPSMDEYDVFTDPSVQRIPVIED